MFFSLAYPCFNIYADKYQKLFKTLSPTLTENNQSFW